MTESFDVLEAAELMSCPKTDGYALISTARLYLFLNPSVSVERDLG